MNQSELITLASANATLNKDFEVKYQNVISDFFSRDPANGRFLITRKFRQLPVPPDHRRGCAADQPAIRRVRICLLSWLVSRMSAQNAIRPEKGQDDLLVFASALCKTGKPAGRGKRYRHAVRPGSLRLYAGSLLGNPNMVYCEYSGVAG